jgi:hypothetical protein
MSFFEGWKMPFYGLASSLPFKREAPLKNNKQLGIHLIDEALNCTKPGVSQIE